MTVVGAIIDPNPSTRNAFVQSLEGRVREYDAWSLEQTAIGDCLCCWRTCSSAPVSLARQGKTTAWVLGHMDGMEEPEQGYAGAILSHFEKKGTNEVAGWSGYFLAIVSREDGYTIFTDRLGLFPCYYATKDGVLLLGTSSDIPTLHAGSSRRPNWRAVVGHMLCMHEVLGESVWEGSSRLGVGEILRVQDGNVRLIRQQAIPVSDDSFGLPYEAQLDRADAAMAQACESYRGKSISILLSGGLDSRLLAGYLSKAGVVPEVVYTLGDPRDIEFQCARRVCSALGWPQTRIPIEFPKYADFVARQIAVEHLSNGMNDLAWWSMVDQIQGTALPVVTGLVGDAVLGGSHILLGYDPASHRYSFDRFFRTINSYGVSRDVVKNVFSGAQIQTDIDEVVERLMRLYESLPGHAFQKAWQFDLMHRQRFHVAGVLRRLSYGSWPFAPLASDSLLTVTGGMPACAIARRRLQQDLLITRFPHLARLPLDRNSMYTKPLLPSVRCRIRSKILKKTGIGRLRLWNRERRYWYRVFSLNNEGWRLVRAECDRALDSVAGIVNLEEWRKILPRWDLDVRAEGDAIAGESGLKSLLGFVLWHRRHVEGDRTR